MGIQGTRNRLVNVSLPTWRELTSPTILMPSTYVELRGYVLHHSASSVMSLIRWYVMPFCLINSF